MKRGDVVVHSSVLWADAAISFIRQHADEEADRPFFLHVAFHAPHDPRQSPRSFLDYYPREEVLIPSNFQATHPFDQGDADSRDEMLAPFPRTADAVRLHRQEYYAIITHADEQIGRSLDALSDEELAENTIVVFSSDHGLAVGEHGLMGKQNQYDHSVRVPLIFAGPGVPDNTIVDSLVYQSSIYPTLCDLLRLPTADTVELPSLAGLMRDGKGVLFTSIFGAYREFQRMVRTTDYKMIAYPQQQRHQLFDMRSDPWEKNDLSGQPSTTEIVSELQAELSRWQDDIGYRLDVTAAFPSQGY